MELSLFLHEFSLGVRTGATIWRRLESTEKSAIGAKSVAATSELQEESLRLEKEYESCAKTGPLFQSQQHTDQQIIDV